MITQRQYDIFELEAQLRVKKLYDEWMKDLLGGRNPTQNMVNNPRYSQELQRRMAPQIGGNSS